MSRLIKLDDRVYHDLTMEKTGNDTYSQVVDRMLDIMRAIRGIEPILAGQKVYQEFKEKQRLAKEAANR